MILNLQIVSSMFYIPLITCFIAEDQPELKKRDEHEV